ncbi:MAG: PilW family protein [Gallionella sp.]|nr:PilW family protein [Gallionella sp.]
MKSPTVKHTNAPALSAIAGKISPQRGLSLIEMMISITIGLLLLVALSSLFVNQSKTRAELDKSNRMIDNGRYALEVLTDNLSLAGFYGEYDFSSGAPPIPAALPDPCTTSAADISAALQLAVQGYDAATKDSQIAGPPCGYTYTAGSDLSLKQGSDILVIRRVSTATPITTVAAAPLAGTHYLQASLCQLDAVPYIVSTTPADFTLRRCTSNGTTLADLRNFMVEVYFVSPNNTSTDSIPTLKRRELDPTSHQFVTTPLVEGIEYMQVEYGLDDPTMDTNKDGVVGLDGEPDNYTATPALADWPNVASVKMNILARNTEATKGYTDTKTYTLGSAGTFGPFNDNFKRHAYTKFIRLINPAGRREIP